MLLNLHASRGSLIHFGLKKVARNAAIVARAQALGIDPDVLRMTPEEANAAILKLAELGAAKGLPVTVIAGSAALGGFTFPPDEGDEP